MSSMNKEKSNNYKHIKENKISIFEQEINKLDSSEIQEFEDVFKIYKYSFSDCKRLKDLWNSSGCCEQRRKNNEIVKYKNRGE